MLDESEVQALKSAALAPLEYGKVFLEVLYNRYGDMVAKVFLQQMRDFDKQKDKEWDELQKQYGVDCVYGLPERVYKNQCKKYRQQLFTMFVQAQKFYPDNKWALLAFKLYLYHSYGFLTDGKLLTMNEDRQSGDE